MTERYSIVSIPDRADYIAVPLSFFKELLVVSLGVMLNEVEHLQ